jgi:nucleoside-diphosphate-sugar epimerase
MVKGKSEGAAAEAALRRSGAGNQKEGTMKALITGASGFIGRVLTERLLTRNYPVRGLVRKTSRLEGLRKPAVELVYGDLADPESLRSACRGIDVVFHTAARANHWGPRDEFYRANVQGTRNVLEAVVAERVPRFIHFSSFAVYGRRRGLVQESCSRQRTGERYTDSKIDAEELVLEWARGREVAWTILRLGVVYGPHDPKWIPTLAENICKGRMRIVGSGDMPVPAVYGEDVADCAVLAAECPAAAGEIFNVLSGEDVTWKEFLSTLATYLGTSLPRAHLPAWLVLPVAGILEGVWKLARAQSPPPAIRFGILLYTADWKFDISKAKALLGYQPQICHRVGLKRTVEWMRAEGLVK